MAFWRNDLLAVNGYNEDIIGWGREDGVGPRELVKFLAQLLKIKGSVIDDIATKGTFSFATVPEKAGLEAVEKSRKSPELPTITIAHQDKPVKDRGRERDRGKNKEKHWYDDYSGKKAKKKK